jgi:hypothetical protein
MSHQAYSELKTAGLSGPCKSLVYEFDMLWGTCELSVCAAAPGEERMIWAINNAAIEDFLLHARALLDFLFEDKAIRDDLVATSFFSDPAKWTSNRQNASPYIEKIRKKHLNQRMAHLTRSRETLNIPSNGWNRRTIAEEIANNGKLFFDLLKKNEPSAWKEFNLIIPIV